MKRNTIPITEIKDKKKQVEILQVCIKRNFRSYKDGTRYVTIPIFLTLVFQCIRDSSHKRYLIFHREDIVTGNIRLIQNCDKCKSKTNLVEVR